MGHISSVVGGVRRLTLRPLAASGPSV